MPHFAAYARRRALHAAVLGATSQVMSPRAIGRVKRMLGMAVPECDSAHTVAGNRTSDIARTQCENAADFGPYGLGHERTVREFEELSGVNFTSRTLAAQSRQFWQERAALSAKYEFYESSVPGGKPRARHRWGSLENE